MKPPIKAETILDVLARELHRQYRAAAKAMGVKGAEAHDHGVRDCGAQKFHYFEKRAALMIKRAGCRTPETLGEAESSLQAMVFIRRSIVEGESIHDIACQMCRVPFHILGGITTSQGYICYGCVKKIHIISDNTTALRERPKADILSDIDQTA